MDTRVDDIIIGALHSYKNPPKKKSGTVTYFTKDTDAIFTRKINQQFLDWVNKTRADLKGTNMGNSTPEVDARNLVKVWGIWIKHANKTIISTKNSVRYVIRPLEKRLQMRQAMLQQSQLRGKTYT